MCSLFLNVKTPLCVFGFGLELHLITFQHGGSKVSNTPALLLWTVVASSSKQKEENFPRSRKMTSSSGKHTTRQASSRTSASRKMQSLVIAQTSFSNVVDTNQENGMDHSDRAQHHARKIAHDHKEQRALRHERKVASNPSFGLVVDLKQLWEAGRKKDCTTQRRTEIVKEMISQLSGKFREARAPVAPKFSHILGYLSARWCSNRAVLLSTWRCHAAESDF